MADTPKEVNSPAYRNVATERQAKPLVVVRDLAAGTERLRERGGAYLPMEAGESGQAYQVRLSRSLLFNTFVKVREGLIGMALKKNPELEPDVPAPLKQHVEDIDLAGTHLDVFAKDLFRDVIQDGHALILVDMEAPLPPGSTRADEIASGRRPYWVKYKKDQAINWKSDRINGETVLTQITLEECATEAEGEYGEKEVIRYRVLKLPKLTEKTPTRSAVYGAMEWALYEKRKVGDKEETIRVAGDRTSLLRIPVVVIYSRRKGLLESDPPLLDLAYLNIGHWQQWSDLNCQLRMLVPILHIKGEILNNPEATAEGAQKPTLKIGPGAVIQTDKDGDVSYASHDGSAIEATRQSLVDLEQRMSAVGLSIISQKQDTEVTATEKVMDQDERMSELASWLRNLKDGIESAFKIHAVDYLGLPEGGSIILGFDEPDTEDKEAVTAINASKGGVVEIAEGGVQ
jgi:hypothetical protein